MLSKINKSRSLKFANTSLSPVNRVLTAPVKPPKSVFSRKELRDALRREGLPLSPRLYREFSVWLKQNEGKLAMDYLTNLRADMEKARAAAEAWQNPLGTARKGQPYKREFAIPEGIYRPFFLGLEEIGLSFVIDYKKETATISGVPTEAGEFTVRMIYGWRFASEVEKRYIKHNLLTRELTLTVAPDPRELWKNLPVDPGIEYPKKNEDAVVLRENGWLLAGASVRGRSHAHSALPRDDDFRLAFHKGWQILVVADGAGSAPFSREGSARACEKAVEVCRNFLDNDAELGSALDELDPLAPREAWLPAAKRAAYQLAPQACFEAWKEIKAEAKEKEREPRDYAATFLLALCRPIRNGYAVVSFQVGDGAMAALTPDEVRLLAEPDEGEYGGQTRFLTMPEIYTSEELTRRLNIDLFTDLDALILMTDGVSDPKFAALNNLRDPARWRALRSELEPVLDSPDPDKALIDWLQFWAQGNHDDRTIAILTRNNNEQKKY